MLHSPNEIQAFYFPLVPVWMGVLVNKILKPHTLGKFVCGRSQVWVLKIIQITAAFSGTSITVLPSLTTYSPGFVWGSKEEK